MFLLLTLKINYNFIKWGRPSQRKILKKNSKLIKSKKMEILFSKARKMTKTIL